MGAIERQTRGGSGSFFGGALAAALAVVVDGGADALADAGDVALGACSEVAEVVAVAAVPRSIVVVVVGGTYGGLRQTLGGASAQAGNAKPATADAMKRARRRRIAARLSRSSRSGQRSSSSSRTDSIGPASVADVKLEPAAVPVED